MKTSFNRSVGQRALILAAGLMAGTSVVAAADLGGNCCADLEERVAELEATTVRKGNRKVSLQLYGQVSEAIMWWNDGAESNVFVLENHDTKNRLGVQGSAKINSDWSAGYKIELQIRAYRSSSYTQLALGASNNTSIPAYNTQSLSLREAHWYIRSNTYGTVTVGRAAEAAASAGTINLASPDGFAGSGYSAGRAHQGLFLRRSGTTGNLGLSALNWNTAFHRNNSNTADYEYGVDHAGVKYTSPFFLGQSKSTGFQASVSWGMDDIWSVGLRYAESLAGFRLAAGVGFSQVGSADMLQCANTAIVGGAMAVPGTPGGNAAGTSVDCEMWQASASLMHSASGLYVSGGWGQLVDNNRKRAAELATAGFGSQISDTDSSWWIQAGWVAKLSSLGATTFWGQYASYESHGNVANQALGTIGATDVLNSFAGTAVNIKTAEATTWGVGVTQDIDAAAMKLYMGYISSSADLTLINRATSQTRKSNAIDDVGVFFTGATIKF
jgi:hypothetical protein